MSAAIVLAEAAIRNHLTSESARTTTARRTHVRHGAWRRPGLTCARRNRRSAARVTGTITRLSIRCRAPLGRTRSRCSRLQIGQNRLRRRADRAGAERHHHVAWRGQPGDGGRHVPDVPHDVQRTLEVAPDRRRERVQRDAGNRVLARRVDVGRERVRKAAAGDLDRKA